METIWDPVRRKLVPLTPEEVVRQWFVDVLHRLQGVPLYKMRTEYGVGEYRADIVVFGKNGRPVLVAECKRPEVEVDEKVLRQALRYHARLGTAFIALTNGERTVFARTSVGNSCFLDKAPHWSELREY